MQFLSGHYASVGPRFVYGDSQSVEIRYCIDRYYLRTARAVDKQVTRDCENKGFGWAWNFFLCLLIDLGIHVLTQILNVALIAPTAT